MNETVSLKTSIKANRSSTAILPRANATQPSLLSFPQQRLWFLHGYEQNLTAYNLTRVLHLRGNLSRPALDLAFETLIERHEILRTRFEEIDGIPHQIVCKKTAFKIEASDGSHWTENELNQAVDNLAHHVFDLTSAPAFAVRLIERSPQHFILILAMHHILSDAWSNSILIKDIAGAYNQALKGSIPVLTPLPIQYADYAKWQRDRAEQSALGREIGFWKTYLGGEIPPLDLPGDHRRPLLQDYSGACLRFEIPQALAYRAQLFCKAEHLTPFVLLLAAWQLTLARASGQNQFAVGVPTANRHRPEVQMLLGFFVGTQVYRVDLKPEITLRDFCRGIRAEALSALDHGDLPFELLLEQMGLKRDPARTPLFQTLFNLQMEETKPSCAFEGVHIELQPYDPPTSKFDLSLDVSVSSTAIRGRFEYSVSLFEKKTIELIQTRFLLALEEIIKDPSQLVGTVSLLGKSEKARLLQIARDDQGYEQFRPVHKIFEETAAANPERIALIFEESQVSYGELNARGNQLACQLMSRGVGPDVIVGIAFERSIDVIVAILAILKSGGAYLPLDPSLARQRLAFMITDSGIKLLLTQATLSASLKGLGAEDVIVIDNALASQSYRNDNPNISLHGDNLVYMIYTSGSTGRPKGVGNRHGALYNRLAWMQDAYALDSTDAVLQKTTLSFDVSVWEVFWPLICGASLVLATPEEHRNPPSLVKRIEHHKITTIHFVPSMLQAFIASDCAEECNSLRRIICSGEALPADLQARVCEQLPNAKLYNLYGPTEAAIDVSHWTCVIDGRDVVPIGRPIANVRLYILDCDLLPVPQGAAGELYIGGEGLARGYVGRPGLTAERFVADPFSTCGERLYRTGDRVKLGADGEIQYLGRLDHQVKIRGFRIELGEIEAQLLAQNGVRESVAVAQDGKLVAYVTGEGFETEALKAALTEVLPDYMVPASVMRLEAMPLNANGKLDRAALPKADFAASSAYEAPQGEAEDLLAKIWENVLTVEAVGRNDNFFERGGDSILCLQIIARLRQHGWKLTPKQIFEHQILHKIAGCIIPIAEDNSSLGRQPAAENESYPLSPLQKGLLFHALSEPESSAYLNQLRLNVRGLDVERFKRAWLEIQSRHDVLRTAFLINSDPVLQKVSKNIESAYNERDWRGRVDLDDALDDLASRELKAGFDLAHPPLHRLALIRTSATSHHLIWTVHHLLLDGWSQSRLFGEVLRSYGGVPLPPLQNRYRDYIAWLARQNGPAAEHFWQQRTRRLDTLSYLSEALSCNAPSTGRASLTLELSSLDVQKLQAFAAREHVTLNTLLQGAWALLLRNYTGQRTLCFGVTVAGRPADLPGAEEMLGLFINTLPIIIDIDPDWQATDWLRDLQTENLNLRDHGHMPLNDVQRLGGHSGRALFDSLLVFENYPIDEALRLAPPAGIIFSDVQQSEETHYPFVIAIKLGTTLRVEFNYALANFDDESVIAIRSDFRRLLENLVQDAQLVLADILYAGPASVSPWPVSNYRTGTVYEIIESHAADRPDAEALVLSGEVLTYRELNDRANRFAHALIGLGIGTESRIGVCLPRSADMIVCLLAILKSGAAYVPFDAELPASRLSYMAKDSGIGLIVTRDDVKVEWNDISDVERIDIANFDPQLYVQDNLQRPIHPQQLAYIIYTSGSTGVPKGVGVSHGPLAMHCTATAELYEMDENSREFHFISFNFDGAHERWLTTLVAGGRLILRMDEAIAVEETAASLNHHRITNAGFPPAYLQQLAAFMEEKTAAPSLHLYSFGGEAMPRTGYDRVRKALRPNILINGYGPTETVVTPLVWKAEASKEITTPYVPIGRPVGARKAYILDCDLLPVPQGAGGELYIGGEGLARGYIGRPGLTAERFVADPFSACGERLYRTGDRVKLGADEEIQYLGRLDHQVKIRGFRIELGEIEAQLLAQNGVREAVAVAQDGKLVAYVTGEGFETEALKPALADTLPDYMVPASLMRLEVMPLNANGKLDRAALPKADFAASSAYEAPQGEAEDLLAKIWENVLTVEAVGRDDNFFERGGDSILCLQIIARLRQQGWKLTPKQIFEHQILHKIAGVAERDRSPRHSKLPKPGDAVSLLPMQAAFFAMDVPVRHHWNQAVLLQSKSTLKAEKLGRALLALVNHHDAFRLRYRYENGIWVQYYSEPHGEAPLWVRSALHTKALAEICHEAQRSLNLADGPLLRVVLIPMTDESSRLLLVIHHLAVDGVSWRILLRDLQQAYADAEADRKIHFPEKGTSLVAWAERLKSYAAEEAGQLAYWQKLACSSAKLPCDHPEGESLQRLRRSIVVSLDREMTRAMLKNAPSAYRTQVNDLLLTALAKALHAWTGSATSLIDLEGHGREDIDPDTDLSQTVGWFTSLYPVLLDASGTPEAALKRIKESLRSIPDHGLGYGVFKYMGNAEQQALLQSLPSAEIIFNYLGQFDGSFEEGGLWKPAQESPEASRDENSPLDYQLTINGQIFDGSLRLDIGFSSARYERETIETFAAIYKDELTKLIAHCCSGMRGATPSDFPLASLTQEQIDALPIDIDQIEDLYPLTSIQQGMIFDALKDPHSIANIVQMEALIDELDIERFRAAWSSAVARHPVLRTSFHWKDGLAAPIQIVSKSVMEPFGVFDWRHYPSADIEWTSLCERERLRGFEFDSTPLMRLTAVRYGERRYCLVWTWHHILLDGWSMSQLLGEICQTYAGEMVSTPKLQFADYMRWLGRQKLDDAETYWRDRLQNASPSILANCFEKPQGSDKSYGVARCRVSAALVKRIQAFAAGQKVTLNSLVQAAWALVLHEHLKKDELVFGVTIAGRSASLPDIDRLMGLCINTLPVILRFDTTATIGDWLRQLQDQNVKARQNEHVPLYEIQRWAGNSAEPLFDNLILFENYPVDAALRQSQREGQLKFSHVVNRGATSCPMTVVVVPGEDLALNLEYSREYFRHETVEHLLAQFELWLLRLVRNGKEQIAAIELAQAAQETRTANLPEAQIVQDRMALLWRDILGVDHVKQDDNFFELGGHSLAAVRLLGTWNKDNPAWPLTLPELYRDPSPRGMAGACMLADIPSASKPVLYCFPAWPWSSAREFRELPEILTDAFDIRFFNCPPHEELKRAHQTMEQLAAGYAHIILRETPTSFAFLGWSIGGLAAYETARQLTGKREPAWVGVIDVPTFSGFRLRTSQARPVNDEERYAMEQSLLHWLALSPMQAYWTSLLSRLSEAERLLFLLDAAPALASGMSPDGPAPTSREYTMWSRITALRLATAYDMPREKLGVPMHSWVAGQARETGAGRIDWQNHAKTASSLTIEETTHEDILLSPLFMASLKTLMAELGIKASAESKAVP